MHVSAFAPLRLLCLHGYYQNAEALQAQMSPLAETLGNTAELVFADGPLVTSYPPEVSRALEARGSRVEEGSLRGWWRSNESPPGCWRYEGWEKAIETVREEAANNSSGPFDGLVGYSQGAALASLVLSSKPCADQWSPSFGLLVSGFIPRDPAAAALVSESPVDTCHVFGARDRIIKPDQSRALAELVGGHTVMHQGGHAPRWGDPDVSKGIMDWLKKQQRLKHQALDGE
ncbi:unnamed protein product [Chrysoparadoxa australica]